jgi:hypothetical protein
MSKTLGERRVRTDFNASNSDVVGGIKHDAALLIDRVNAIALTRPDGTVLSAEDSAEQYRLKVLAMDALEEAAMWAVKAATL